MFQTDQNKIILIFVLIVVTVAVPLLLTNIPHYTILLILLGSVIFFIAFFKTDVALIILILSMLLSPEFGLGGIQGRSVVIRFDDIFIFMLFFGWFAKMAVNKEIGFLKITPINQPIIIYILVCLGATIFGILRGTTVLKYSLFYILKYIEYFLIFFLLSNNLHDRKQIKKFLFFMFLTCLIVGIYAVVFSGGVRASAPFEGEAGEPNTLAGYLLLMMGIMMGIVLYTDSMKIRLALGGLFAFSIIPLVNTLSRSGWVGFSAMFISFIILSRRRKGPLIFGILGMLILAPIIMPNAIKRSVEYRVKETFEHGKSYEIMGRTVRVDESAAARYRSWDDALEQWTKNPLIGTGVASGRVLHDMQYSRLLREVGIIGFFSFIWIIIRLFKISWQSFMNPDRDNFDQGLCLGFICSLIGLLVMGLGAEVFILIRIMEPFWFLTAIVVSLPEVKDEGQLVLESV